MKKTIEDSEKKYKQVQKQLSKFLPSNVKKLLKENYDVENYLYDDIYNEYEDEDRKDMKRCVIEIIEHYLYILNDRYTVYNDPRPFSVSNLCPEEREMYEEDKRSAKRILKAVKQM